MKFRSFANLLLNYNLKCNFSMDENRIKSSINIWRWKNIVEKDLWHLFEYGYIFSQKKFRVSRWYYYIDCWWKFNQKSTARWRARHPRSTFSTLWEIFENSIRNKYPLWIRIASYEWQTVITDLFNFTNTIKS